MPDILTPEMLLLGTLAAKTLGYTGERVPALEAVTLPEPGMAQEVTSRCSCVLWSLLPSCQLLWQLTDGCLQNGTNQAQYFACS